MSSQAAAITRALLTRADYCLQASSVVVLYYDYLLTLPAEVEYIWKNPFRFITFLDTDSIPGSKRLINVPARCIVVRLTASVLSTFGHFGIISRPHAHLSRIDLKLTTEDAPLAVWGLRTYAICDGNKIIAALIGLTGLSVVVMRIAITSAHIAYARQVGDSFEFRHFGIATGALMMTFEALSFLFAAIRALRTLRNDKKFWENPRATLNAVIFSQGLIYITAVFALSILTATFNLKVWGGTVIRPMNSLKLPLAGLLTARFLLKIKMWERRESATSAGEITTLQFNPVAIEDVKGKSKGTTSAGTTDVEADRDGIHFDDDDDDPGYSTRRVPVIRELGRDIGPRRTNEVGMAEKWRVTDYEWEREQMHVFVDEKAGERPESSQVAEPPMANSNSHA
ncbi:hypothetical protein CC1G_04927 [Coprinopsis cinerea okayama7|uniref:DUF6533 domain-containing protein n=1 Tax=Coprinopsis cinerea (strain Okayama-7 / 130 / ATCC MYA-4618 / FGSC 9003) TaxID=240176 RepID=A8PFK5_COPC7|nr:hypothetical protein CC1G_04927 [Coprinopsis cinerea okayama7\|eukprot:XP_001841083.1 hypothetical protein CC1G_04927 [Coprinopsis cinerea okayama7\